MKSSLKHLGQPRKVRYSYLRIGSLQINNISTSKDKKQLKNAVDSLPRPSVKIIHKSATSSELKPLNKHSSLSSIRLNQLVKGKVKKPPLNILKELKKSHLYVGRPRTINSHRVEEKTIKESPENTSFTESILKGYMENP